MVWPHRCLSLGGAMWISSFSRVALLAIPALLPPSHADAIRVGGADALIIGTQQNLTLYDPDWGDPQYELYTVGAVTIVSWSGQTQFCCPGHCSPTPCGPCYCAGAISSETEFAYPNSRVILSATNVHPDAFPIELGTITVRTDGPGVLRAVPTRQASGRSVDLISTVQECNDSTDNDSDTYVGFPSDLGCQDTLDISELFDCEDGLDND